MTEDKAAVRELLGHAVAAEPALDLNPHELVRSGRRRVARRRAAVTGGVAVAVAAAILGTSLLTAPGRAGDRSVTAAGPPPATPLPADDARSQRLTSAFAAAHLVPAGMTVEEPRDFPMRMIVEEPPGSVPKLVPPSDAPLRPVKPLQFFRAALGNYQMHAQLRDGRGYGRLVINIDPTMPSTDMLNCAAVVKGPCTERTFPDGSRARVDTIAGPIGVSDSTMLRLIVRRPNGSFLEVYVDNASELGPAGPTPPPTRDEPPLTVEQLFQIAATPTITY
jgi:hypothetical protein